MTPISFDPKTIALAAMSETNPQELIFDIDEVIRQNDATAVWDFVPRLAAADSLTWGRCRQKLLAKFGSNLCVRLLDSQVKEEQQKNRDAARVAREQGIDRPTIQVNQTPLRDQSDKSVAALVGHNDPPVLFVRNGQMVEIRVDEQHRSSIAEVTRDGLRGRMDRCADYVKRGNSYDAACNPPHDVVDDILALPSAQWRLPSLDVLVESPTLRQDGSLLDEDGYDPHSKTYYSRPPNLDMHPIPDPQELLYDDVEDAVAALDDAVCDFPFAPAEDGGPSPSRANFFGLLLTPIVRPAITGCTPIALIDAPQPGTGKTLLAEVFSMIITGRPAALMPFPRDEEEMPKLILSMLSTGKSMVAFDNLEGPLKSDALALALTSQQYESRLLGSSRTICVPNRATWLVTGNNIRPTGDMVRRCYKIRIDAASSVPYRGRTFRHDPLLPYIAERRGALLRALLVLATAWRARGNPRTVTDPLGSFEEWHRTVGGILEYAGVGGFLGNLEEVAQGDDMAAQWEAFLGGLLDTWGENYFTVRNIVDRVRQANDMYPCPFALPDSVGDVDRRAEGKLEKVLGMALAKRVGTRMGRRQLHLVRRQDPHTKTAIYRVAEVG